MTQAELVLGYMQVHKEGITQMDAYNLEWNGKPCHITRLSAIIFNLKEKRFALSRFKRKGKTALEIRASGFAISWLEVRTAGTASTPR